MRIQNPGARIQNETKPLSDILKRFSCFVVTGIPVMAVYMRIQNPGARIQNETKPLSDILKRFSCFVVTGIPVMAVSGICPVGPFPGWFKPPT